jgi:hypothetical protein
MLSGRFQRLGLRPSARSHLASERCDCGCGLLPPPRQRLDASAQPASTVCSAAHRSRPTQDLLSGLAAAGQRSARVQGLPGSRSNPNLFERDEGDEAAVSEDLLFGRDGSEAATTAARVQRLSVSNALRDARRDVGDLDDAMGVDIDALAAAAAAAAEHALPVKKEPTPVKSTPQKASGTAAAALYIFPLQLPSAFRIPDAILMQAERRAREVCFRT